MKLHRRLSEQVNKFAPKILTRKPNPSTKKTKLVRPRYYSTELGIREKMFVGIFTSEEKINTQAVHINKTIGHLVDRIKFFITAQYKLKTKFNLTGLVGFTDARHKYRPFQVIKYVGDSFAQDYDYYFFANDYTFINVHRLKDIVNKISVSMDVYLGTKVKDSSYCNLDAGIVISSSVLKAMRTHLDWCIMNAISEDHSENIGRCIYHSLGLSCQEAVQVINCSTYQIYAFRWKVFPPFKLKHFELGEHLLELTGKANFNDAVTIYPVLQKDDFYLLNAYFFKVVQNLEILNFKPGIVIKKQRLSILHEETQRLSEPLTEVWPPGQRPGAKPATRFDLPRQFYFNMTHIFFPDDFTNTRPHMEADLLDIENVIDEVKATVANKYPRNLQYRRLINGYRVFDLSRGMDYTLDLGFRDLNTGKEVIKRFEVCKPLGKVEFILVPYVTETTRVTILLPIQEMETSLAMDFLANYSTLVMDRKEKTFLMLVLLYQYNSESKGTTDPFSDVKNFVTKAAVKYKNDDAKIAWVSIRLPESPVPLTVEDNKSLNFATVDLALRKVGVDSLTLVLSVYCNITVDFLNRVRMNTILNHQIFSPIPFRQYDPKISQYKSLEVNKNTGHFDREEYRFISFYGRDYVIARKKYQHKMPLIRTDNDIVSILGDEHKNVGNLFEMFVKYTDTLHCMRATEMSLKVVYHEENDKTRKNLFLGNEAELAKLLLTKRDEIIELA
ncbi:hypothetical protein NQ318_021571 [Aromia moschata]|uniref:Hexosyltransferase n=1 Tax=Aromia moschata TaxID=1265417 RepID=A0AAV8YHY6_9CUCU|nr:hypothetical protein NQ318_021571 [Aromia moschata]